MYIGSAFITRPVQGDMFCVFVAKGGQFAGHTSAIRQTTVRIPAKPCPDHVQAVVTIQVNQRFVQGSFLEKIKSDLEEAEHAHTIAYGKRSLDSELFNILQNVMP